MASKLLKRFGIGGKNSPPQPPNRDYSNQKSGSVDCDIHQSTSTGSTNTASDKSILGTSRSSSSNLGLCQGDCEITQLSSSPNHKTLPYEKNNRLKDSTPTSGTSLTLGSSRATESTLPKENSFERFSETPEVDSDIYDLDSLSTEKTARPSSKPEKPVRLEEDYSDPVDVKKQISGDLLGACGPAHALLEDDYSVPYEVKKLFKEGDESQLSPKSSSKQIIDPSLISKSDTPSFKLKDQISQLKTSPSNAVNPDDTDDNRPKEDYDEPWEWSARQSMALLECVSQGSAPGNLVTDNSSAGKSFSSPENILDTSRNAVPQQSSIDSDSEPMMTPCAMTPSDNAPNVSVCKVFDSITVEHVDDEDLADDYEKPIGGEPPPVVTTPFVHPSLPVSSDLPSQIISSHTVTNSITTSIITTVVNSANTVQSRPLSTGEYVKPVEEYTMPSGEYTAPPHEYTKPAQQANLSEDYCLPPDDDYLKPGPDYQSPAPEYLKPSKQSAEYINMPEELLPKEEDKLQQDRPENFENSKTDNKHKYVNIPTSNLSSVPGSICSNICESNKLLKCTSATESSAKVGNYEEPWDLSASQCKFQQKLKAASHDKSTTIASSMSQIPVSSPVFSSISSTITSVTTAYSVNKSSEFLSLHSQSLKHVANRQEREECVYSKEEPTTTPSRQPHKKDSRSLEGYEKPWDWKPHQKDDRTQLGYEKPWDWKPHQKDDRPQQGYEKPWDWKPHQKDDRPREEYDEPWENSHDQLAQELLGSVDNHSSLSVSTLNSIHETPAVKSSKCNTSPHSVPFFSQPIKQESQADTKSNFKSPVSKQPVVELDSLHECVRQPPDGYDIPFEMKNNSPIQFLDSHSSKQKPPNVKQQQNSNKQNPPGISVAQTSSPSYKKSNKKHSSRQTQSSSVKQQNVTAAKHSDNACSVPSSVIDLVQPSPSDSLTAGVERIDPGLPLEQQGWYHGSISRVDAEKLLRIHKEGSYLVRMSESNKQDYSLSLKSARGFMHMKIVNRDSRYILGQFSQPFDSIPLMIYHYSLSKLPIKGAEHMSLLHPVINELL